MTRDRILNILHLPATSQIRYITIFNERRKENHYQPPSTQVTCKVHTLRRESSGHTWPHTALDQEDRGVSCPKVNFSRNPTVGFPLWQKWGHTMFKNEHIQSKWCVSNLGKRKQNKGRKKMSTFLVLRAKFQLRIYFYSCDKLLEVVILGNHFLLTWVSLSGGTVTEVCLILLSEWLQNWKNSHSATFGYDWLSQF